jgi:hypothetical protein
VVTHPFVVGELACGQLANRLEMLHLLSTLPTSAVATDAEVRRLIEGRRLMGKGLGYMDVHLLASAILTEDASLSTRDKQLATIAMQLGIVFEHP